MFIIFKKTDQFKNLSYKFYAEKESTPIKIILVKLKCKWEKIGNCLALQ